MPSTTTRNQNGRSLFFCDRDHVEKLIEGKSVALVGSGPGVLDNPPGFVDVHEVVVRVNNHRIIPGSGTGQRTDVHYSFYGSSIKKTPEELKNEGVKLCWAKCPDAQFMESEWHKRRQRPHGVDFRYIYRNRASWWFCPTYVPTVSAFVAHFELLGNHIPTTGFAALLDVLSCNPRNVYVTGFDFFQTRVHNVNEPWKDGHPGDPIRHRPDLERQWFLNNAERLPITMDALLAQAVSEGVAPRIKAPEHPKVVHLRHRLRRRA